MLRLSRPAIVVFAVALLVALHFLFIQPVEHAPASSSKVAGRQIPRPRKPFVPSPPKSKKKTSIKGRKASKGKEAVSEDGLDIDTRGLTAYVEGSSEKHPIELLIERGRRLAKAAEARIREVTSVDDSADEYERAFGMKPPKGYDTWFKFTQSSPEPHPPPNPSLFPLVHTPFDAHLAIPANILRERVADLREKDGFFTIRFVPDGTGDEGTACKKDEEWYPELSGERGKGRVIIAGTQAWSWRCNNTLNLILPIIPNMPKEFFTMKPPLEVAFSSADGPRSIIHNSFRQRSEAFGRSLKEWPKGQLLKAEQAMRWTWGWQWTCPEGAPLKKSNTDVVLNDLGAVAGLNGDQAVMSVPSKEKTFIADFAKAADFCYNPDLMQYHHSLLQDSAAGSSALVPNVAACRLVNNADIVGVPLDGVHEVVDVVDWKDKDLKKVFWRGSATGLFHSKETQWRQSQRERLHWFSHNTSDATVSVLVDRGASVGLKNEPWKVKDLNEAWLDVGLSGKPNQCSTADGTCDEMAREIDFMGRVRKEDATRFKFVLDVDGNGWSSRFRRLLAGNNVVLKSTLYPEWHSEMLIPWYHYVPLKLDYSDMYDILSFFMGAPDGSTAGRDDLAEEIAANALRFTEERWRMSDMQSYTYLLLLEFWRLMSDDREETSYQAEL